MSKIAIRLFHGRNTPDEEMDDWGFDGPVLGPFDSFHVTYLSHFRFIELGGNKEFELKFKDDVLEYKGKYYGDFVIAPVETLEKEGFKIEPPEE